MTKKKLVKKIIKCSDCMRLMPHDGNNRCNRCNTQRRINKIQSNCGLKKCECSFDCNVMIPIINRNFSIAKYAHGHNTTGKLSPTYKYGTQLVKDYVYIKRKHHKYATKSGRVLLSRYRKELELGRYLDPKEVVHHIDGNPLNNNESNLMLFSSNGLHCKYEWEQKKN